MAWEPSAACGDSSDAVLVDVAVPREIAELLVPHGSITVDGVSLTVNAIPEPSVVQLSLIEYTLRHTTLGDLDAGRYGARGRRCDWQVC